MTLPADATKVHMDSAADDPKQARAELADLVDKFNALIDHLQLSVITNDPLAIGQGIESDGAGNLRVKLDGATIARSASGIKVAASQLGVGNFANITANRVIGSSGAGVVGEISASEGVQIASSVAKLDINGLTAETTVATASDYIAMYDASAAAHRKVLVEDIASDITMSVQVFTGNGTYTKPSNLVAALVICQGGGGGGTAGSNGGGGGGGGGCAIELLQAAAIGSTVTVTIGAGGAAGASGGTSSFGALCSATGGSGGSNGDGGAGGGGSGGTLNFEGSDGGWPPSGSAGGQGGASFLGGGGRASGSAGTAGNNYGGGGGGAGSGGGGGAGAGGAVLVIEWVQA